MTNCFLCHNAHCSQAGVDGLWGRCDEGLGDYEDWEDDEDYEGTSDELAQLEVKLCS